MNKKQHISWMIAMNTADSILLFIAYFHIHFLLYMFGIYLNFPNLDP